MNHLYRGPGFSYNNPKSIHDTSNVLNAKHHIGIGCVNPGDCKAHGVDTSDGYFLHHRIGYKVKETCNRGKCPKIERDTVALKYKIRLETAMKNMLVKIFK